MKNILIFLSLLPLTPVSLSAYFDLDCDTMELNVTDKEQKKEATHNLVWAAKCGNPKKALAALRAGADVNGDRREVNGISMGDIPLTEACRMKACLYKDRDLSPRLARRYLATIALLLEHGALTTAMDNEGKTAVSYACKKGQTTILALLLKHGAPYEEETERTVRHRIINFTGLWAITFTAVGFTQRALLPTVDQHITEHEGFRETDPALASLLKKHKTSFKIIRETSV